MSETRKEALMLVMVAMAMGVKSRPSTPVSPRRGRKTRIMNKVAYRIEFLTSADALAMTNSVAATVRDLNGQLLFDGQLRGICGEAIRTASTDQAAMFAKLIQERDLRLRIVGVGGASTAAHVQAYLDAGAHAVHLATSAMLKPTLAVEIKSELAAAPAGPTRR